MKNYNSLLESVDICVRQMITISQSSTVGTPLYFQRPLTMSRQFRFDEKWQSILSVAWTNLEMHLVQLNDSVMVQRQNVPNIDNSIAAAIIGGTKCNVIYNNKLSNHNCLGM